MDPHLIEKYVHLNVSILKSLANTKRLYVLLSLCDGEKTVTEIQNLIDKNVQLSQSSLSQHLGRMREDGIVESRRDSRNIYYSLKGDTVKRILQCLHDICEDAKDQGSSNSDGSDSKPHKAVTSFLEKMGA